MGNLLDLGLSILTGGATGLLGTAISGVIDIFQGRQKNAQEVELRKQDIELAKIEGASAANVAAVRAEAEADRAEWEALEASYQAATSRVSRAGDSWLLQSADFLVRITRPGLTWFLWGLVGVIYFFLADEVMQTTIIDSVLYVATAAGLWWFGARQVTKMRGGK